MHSSIRVARSGLLAAFLVFAVALPAAGVQTYSTKGAVTQNPSLTGVTAAETCPTGSQAAPTQTIYLPNITKTLGGPTGWVTPFIVQNTGTVATTLEVSFYKFSDGSCVARRTVSLLGPGTSFADVPNNDSDLPGDTQFSVVVKSFGSTIVSVVNEHAGAGARAEALSYNGVSSGATTVSLPNIVRRFFGYHTPFIIQNLGTASTIATATFRPFAGGASVQVVRTIAPGQSQFVEPNVESVLSDGTQYAVTVTATQPVAVVVNTHNDDATVEKPVAYATDGIAAGAETVYGPYAAKNANDAGFAGTTSTIVVQNLGSGAAMPTIALRQLGGGTLTTFTGPSVASGAAWVFDPRYQNGVAGGTLCGTAASPGCLGDGEYSFSVSATGANLTAAVNVISASTAMNVTRTLGGTTGWSTPILLQSVTARSASVEWRRFSDGQLMVTQNVSLALGSAMRIDPRSVSGLIDDTQYAVTITGTDGTVAAIVSELNFSGGDGAMAYEGFAAP